jgi:adenylate cyclase class IV
MSLETETKFDASLVSVEAFVDELENMGASYTDHFSCIDYYLECPNLPYIRYRDLTIGGELTIKKSTSDPFSRKEINITCKGQDIKNIEDFYINIGYKLSFSIKKETHLLMLNGVRITYDKITNEYGWTVFVVEFEQTLDSNNGYLHFISKTIANKLKLLPLNKSNFERFRPH